MMKKVLFGVLLFTIGNVNMLHAQFDLTSKKVLDKLSAKYQSFNTIKADVLLSFEDTDKQKHIDEGTLAMERASGKFKIDLGGHEIINNGKTQWTILKDLAEIQIANAEKDERALTPATIFTFYKKGYKGSFSGVEKVGNRTLDAITLIPTDADQNISKITLRVDQKSNLIYDATLADKNGGKFTYTINNLLVNESIPYTFFIFNKNNYPSMEIVDLR